MCILNTDKATALIKVIFQLSIVMRNFDGDFHEKCKFPKSLVFQHFQSTALSIQVIRK